MPRRADVLVVVSDTHCGSKTGLLPPGCRDANGAEYGLSEYQRWKWERWQFCTGPLLNRIVGKDPFDLVINGDVIEGVHHGTTEVVDADPQQHSQIATVALGPLAERANRLWMVQGTECHTRASEDSIGKGLGAEANKESRRYSWMNLDLEYRGVTVSCTHHISASLRVWTESSGLGLAMNSERLERLRAAHDQARVFIRSHRHVHGVYSDGHSMLAVTPAWQGKGRHLGKVKAEAIPAVGILVLDWRRCDEGELPAVYCRPYYPPARKPANR